MSLGLNSIMSFMPSQSSGVATEGSLVQKTLQKADGGAFKWIEAQSTAEDFAGADSALIGFGPATYAGAKAGQEFTLIGLCNSFQFSQATHVSTLKEMRAEGTRIIPGKAQPGSISISRLMTSLPTFTAIVTGDTGWKLNAQSPKSKSLFGIVVTYMSPLRSSTYATLFFERCAITNISSAIQAGQHMMYETISIVYDKVLDNTSQGGSNVLTQEQNIFLGNTAPNNRYVPPVSGTGLQDLTPSVPRAGGNGTGTSLW